MTSEKPILWGAGAAVVVAAAALYYYYGYTRHAVQAPAPPAHIQQAPPAASEPTIEHPVPPNGGGAPQPLPALNDSDSAVSGALTGLSGALGKFLVPQNLVRHIVATIDNLPRKKVAVELRPIQPTAGSFAVTGTPGHLTLDPGNFQRYTPFVDLVKSIDAKQLVAVYFHFYPLFQQAYEDLGYPTEYFNDRVIQVIDHLLETPDVQGPIELVQPNVMYLYADPKLEALSAGQKTLIRMGSANAAVIEGKLREIRQLIATHAGASAPGSGAAQPPAGSPTGSPATRPTGGANSAAPAR
jgi:hypothetical protein